MYKLNDGETLTKVTKYNLMTSGKSIQIDIHEVITGTLAAKFIAVPNLVMIIARPEYQGAGDTEELAMQDCLSKIKDVDINDLFPQKK